MRASVYNVLLTATFSLLLIFPAAFLRAQMTPIRVLVSKVQKYANAGNQNVYTGSGYGWGASVTSRVEPSTVYCDVKIQYMGVKPVKSARVAWKMLVQAPNVTKPSVEQGEKTVDLQLGKDVEFQTGTENGKALGYIVEVSTNDQVLASSVEPADIKAKIEKAKAP
jgi:hypothetical protein